MWIYSDIIGISWDNNGCTLRSFHSKLLNYQTMYLGSSIVTCSLLIYGFFLGKPVLFVDVHLNK